MILKNSTDFETIINDGITLVDFFATWCGPCKMLAPVLEQLEEVNVLKVDVDEFSSIARKYEIFAVPTIILFKDGEEVKRHSGFMDLNRLKEFVNI